MQRLISKSRFGEDDFIRCFSSSSRFIFASHATHIRRFGALVCAGVFVCVWLKAVLSSKAVWLKEGLSLSSYRGGFPPAALKRKVELLSQGGWRRPKTFKGVQANLKAAQGIRLLSQRKTKSRPTQNAQFRAEPPHRTNGFARQSVVNNTQGVSPMPTTHTGKHRKPVLQGGTPRRGQKLPSPARCRTRLHSGQTS